MRGFQRLRKLELAIEVAVCNITAAAASRVVTPNKSRKIGDDSMDRDNELIDAETFNIGDLVPSSVAQLSLISAGTAQHAMALEMIFCDIASRKDEVVLKLEEIRLSCPTDADDTSSARRWSRRVRG